MEKAPHTYRHTGSVVLNTITIMLGDWGYAPKEKILKNRSLHEVEFLGTSEAQLYVAIMYMVLIVILIESPYPVLQLSQTTASYSHIIAI